MYSLKRMFPSSGADTKSKHFDAEIATAGLLFTVDYLHGCLAQMNRSQYHGR
jgi:hypothetical protein